MKIFVWNGKERCEVDAHFLQGGDVLSYKSPWTGKQITVPFERPRKKRSLWTATEIFKLESRLAKSRRCPERPATNQKSK